MQVEYTGRQTEVSEEIRALAERKLKKLSRVLRGITHVHVIIGVDKHRHLAEVSVRSPRWSLAARDETGDFAVSLATVLDKLIRQAKRHNGKRQERKRRLPARAAARSVRA
jgi:putative sigma-54 modulation protein